MKSAIGLMQVYTPHGHLIVVELCKRKIKTFYIKNIMSVK
jgi:hypothetical protein